MLTDDDGAYRLVVAASAERALARLPEAVAAAIVELMVGPLADSPRRVGHPPQRELSDLWSARRGSYRVIDEIDDTATEVRALRIDYRSDVYSWPEHTRQGTRPTSSPLLDAVRLSGSW